MERKRTVEMFAETAMFFDLPDQPDSPGARCAFFLRTVYRKDRAKLIARDFDKSESTAKLWLAGQLPANKDLIRMDEKFGPSFWPFVTGRMRLAARLDLSGDLLRAKLSEAQNDSLASAANARPTPTTGELAPQAGYDLETDRGPRDRGGA